jgi:hypothetical protein
VELFYIAVVTECISPPSSVLGLVLIMGEGVRRTCSFLREDEGVPSLSYVLGDALFLLRRGRGRSCYRPGEILGSVVVYRGKSRN